MTLLQCRYGTFEIAAADTPELRSLRKYGEWREREIVLMRRFVGDAGVVAEFNTSAGAHALAFARIVGADGRVHVRASHTGAMLGFEKSVTLNRLEKIVTMSGGSGLAGLERLDLLHVGEQTDAGEVVRGAAPVIAACRPVIAIDEPATDVVAELHAWAGPSGYSVFAHTDYRFNPENLFESAENIYGNDRQVLLLLVPNEKLPTYDLRSLVQLTDAGAFAACLAAQAAGPEWGPARPLRESMIDPDPEPLALVSGPFCVAESVHIVVPFYKQPELVEPLFRSLDAIAAEIREIGGKVFFYNDSPDHAGLQAELDRCRFSDPEVKFKVVRNAANLGFIGTCNAAFAQAKQERADVILLNSDTLVFPGAFREMLAVGQLDPMIGFVSPRSNNATLATLPHSFLDRETPPEVGYAAFLRDAATLPRFSFVPTAVGFCLLVKWGVHSELGGFDTVYGAGYNEENDLIMRANRCGYRPVLANRAFVWHQGEQSFGSSAQAKAARENKNAPILSSRYPEYLSLIRAYFTSPEYRAEDLIEYVAGKNGRLTIAFDFSAFGPYFSGTFESGIRLLEAATRTWPEHCQISVYINPAAWTFHGLGRLPRVNRLDVDDPSAKVSAIVRVGQPFDVHAIERLGNRAPVFGVFMLDTIAHDCGYLSLAFDDKIWRFVFEQVDVLFTNSRYTLDRISNRFKLGPRVLRRISRHSLDIREYAQAADSPAVVTPHMFIIGNHFSHKFVRPAADALASAFPEKKIIAVGYGDPAPELPNIESYVSGNLSDEMFESFYSDAEVVIFPSHYEGFGFPILHSLARKRPIYVRHSELYRELETSIEGAENIHYFCTMEELVDQLRRDGAAWTPAARLGEQGGWDRSAQEVFRALEQARATVTYDSLVTRLSQLDQLLLSTTATAVAPTGARRIGHKVELAVERLLRMPGMRPVAQRAWRVVQRLRA